MSKNITLNNLFSAVFLIVGIICVELGYFDCGFPILCGGYQNMEASIMMIIGMIITILGIYILDTERKKKIIFSGILVTILLMFDLIYYVIQNTGCVY